MRIKARLGKNPEIDREKGERPLDGAARLRAQHRALEGDLLRFEGKRQQMTDRVARVLGTGYSRTTNAIRFRHIRGRRKSGRLIRH